MDIRKIFFFSTVIIAQITLSAACSSKKKQYKDHEVSKPDKKGYILQPYNMTKREPTNKNGGQSEGVIRKPLDAEVAKRIEENSWKNIYLNSGAGGISQETTLNQSKAILSDSPYFLKDQEFSRGISESFIQNTPTFNSHFEGVSISWNEISQKPVWIGINFFSDTPTYNGGIYLGDNLPLLQLNSSLENYYEEASKITKEEFGIYDLMGIIWQNFAPNLPVIDIETECLSGESEKCMIWSLTDDENQPIPGSYRAFFSTNTETDKRMLQINIYDGVVAQVFMSFLDNDIAANNEQE